MNLSGEHYRETDTAIAEIREIEARDGVTRKGLEAIQARMMTLAQRTDLFNLEHFPLPPLNESTGNYLYRLHEDADHRFALYVNASRGKYRSPVHNHTTWAVIAGVSGDELNRFYERTQEGGIRETSQTTVRQGSSVGLLPDDLHAIEIAQPLLNFHLYGLALEQLTRRVYYKADENKWVVFHNYSHVREARAGRTG